MRLKDNKKVSWRIQHNIYHRRNRTYSSTNVQCVTKISFRQHEETIDRLGFQDFVLFPGYI